jgi:uncharacterized iron-regulated protein
MKKILWIVMLIMSMTTYAQKTPEIFRIFDAKGKEVSYEKMIKTVSATDVVFFGEIHNCVISHWMELKVLETLAETNKKLKVGMEMLEADNQLIINEYTSSLISSDRFEEECRLWPNHSTDYEPLVYYAKRHHLPLIATNVPRRYASVVKEKGLAFLDSLSAEAKRYLPKLPIKYVENENAQAGFALMGLLGKAKETKPQLMAQAQAIKDATMGWFIAQNLKKGEQMIHFNGTYHSDARNGIIPYLLEYRPKTTISTIRAVRQEEIDKIEKDYLGLADFYICITEDMNMSY